MAKPWSSRPKRAARRAFSKTVWAELTNARNAEFAARVQPEPPPSPPA